MFTDNREKWPIPLMMIVFIFYLLLIPSVSMSQVYKVGHGDVLSISFWQQPDLNTSVRVDQEGKILLPVIGELLVVGLTPAEIGDKIVEKISIYNKDITQASVIVTSYGSNKIYVTGHVLSPGKFTFEKIPNLWEAILEAGGAAETALLTHVNIIRGDAGRKVNADNLEVNLTKMLEKGDLTNLPKLYPGDTIYIPGITEEVGGMTSSSPQVSKNYIYIYGSVNKPGVYSMEERLDLLRAVVLAGGPSIDANLEKVRLISQLDLSTTVVTFNLKEYTTIAEPSKIIINPGDTIYIPRKPSSFWSAFGDRMVISQVIRVLLTTTASILIYSAVR